MSTITRPVAVRMMPVSFTDDTVVPIDPSMASGRSKGSRRPAASYLAPAFSPVPADSSLATAAVTWGSLVAGWPAAVLGVRGADVPGAGKVPGVVEVVGADGGEPPQADRRRARPTQPTGAVCRMNYLAPVRRAGGVPGLPGAAEPTGRYMYVASVRSPLTCTASP